jgi:hypothetical protein
MLRNAHLARSHGACEFLNKPSLSLGVVSVPPTEPKSVACEVLEYEERCRKGQGTLCHCTVCHQMGIAAQKARHSRRRLTADAIQTKADILFAADFSMQPTS